MDFATAWDHFAVGDRIKVSDGKPPPSTNLEGVPFKAWRSHNFTGQLVAKNPGHWRSLVIELPENAGAVVAYTLTEGVGHDFAVPL